MNGDTCVAVMSSRQRLCAPVVHVIFQFQQFVAVVEYIQEKYAMF